MAAHFSISLSLCLYVLMILPMCYGGRLSVSRQNLDIQKHLNRLNKPPVKSIKSPDGDIIDCILISQQPAFDHPSLKNHTIKTRPDYHPEGLFDESKVSKNDGSKQQMTQLWHLNGKCPEGTIPVRRTKKEDLLRAGSIERFGKKDKYSAVPHPKPADPDAIDLSVHEHAVAIVYNDKYYGTKATINIWQPKVQQSNEFSLSQLWVIAGSYSDSDLNTIEAGWQVYPDIYGDNHPRFFIYWTSDAYETTGCYNLFCSGFVQTNNEIAMGGSLSPISSYGSSQYEFTLLVWKDPKGGDWWFQCNGNYIGYWPSSLFTHLQDSASRIDWGGEIINTQSAGQHTRTQMGSGHFPREGFGKSSYFRDIQLVDGSNQLWAPNNLLTHAAKPGCYDINSGKSDNWGTYFFYGGRGRNPNCP